MIRWAEYGKIRPPRLQMLSIPLCPLSLYNLICYSAPSWVRWSVRWRAPIRECARVCRLICASADGLRCGCKPISLLTQIMRLNDDKLFLFCRTFPQHKSDEFWMRQEMKFICRHNKVMSAKARSLSLSFPPSPSASLYTSTCTLSLCGWANPTTQSAL